MLEARNRQHTRSEISEHMTQRVWTPCPFSRSVLGTSKFWKCHNSIQSTWPCLHCYGIVTQDGYLHHGWHEDLSSYFTLQVQYRGFRCWRWDESCLVTNLHFGNMCFLTKQFNNLIADGGFIALHKNKGAEWLFFAFKPLTKSAWKENIFFIGAWFKETEVNMWSYVLCLGYLVSVFSFLTSCQQFVIFFLLGAAWVPRRSRADRPSVSESMFSRTRQTKCKKRSNK